MSFLTIIDHRSDDPERMNQLVELSREGQRRYEQSIKPGSFKLTLSWPCPDCEVDHEQDVSLDMHNMWHVHYRMEELIEEDGSTYVRGGAQATYLAVKCPESGGRHMVCLDSATGG